MTLRGQIDGTLLTDSSQAPGAWKPARNLDFHIPPAATALMGNFANLPKAAETLGSPDSCTEPKKQGPCNISEINTSIEFEELPGGQETGDR